MYEPLWLCPLAAKAGPPELFTQNRFELKWVKMYDNPDYMTKVKPDGYVMMMAAIGTNAVFPAMNRKLPFSHLDLTDVPGHR